MPTELHHGLRATPEADWRRLAPGDRLDRSRAYLGFREHVEPGDPVLITVEDDSGLSGALHGALTTARTPLFSHPWKMLTNSQFLRCDDGSGRAETAVLHRQGELLRTVTGREPDRAEPWAALAERLGQAVVVRGFDTSEVILRNGLPQAERQAAIRSLLRRAQAEVGAGLAGALVLPFVRPGDAELKQLLAECGFTSGVLTGVSLFDLSGARSYDEFVAALPKRRRRRYRNEQSQFTESGMRLSTVPLAGEHLGRIVELEAANAEKYGGTPDRDGLLRVRGEMAALLGESVRVPVVERDGTVIACGIDLVDRDSYYGLVYGCDYSVPDRGVAYPNLCFYDPLRFSADHGIRRIRMGFEAFTPKLIRGARLELRETWIWTPEQRTRDGLGALLDLLSERSRGFFEPLATRLD